MKIKRIVANDMSQGLRRVRDEAGPDAVILSQKRIEEGIEILCAVDYDAEEPPKDASSERISRLTSAIASRARKASAAEAAGDGLDDLWRDLKDDVTQVSSSLPDKISERTRELSGRSEAPTVSAWDEVDSARPDSRGADRALVEEVQNLKALFEHQLSVLEWTKFARRHPQHVMYLRSLTAMGIEAGYAQKLVDEVPGTASPEKGWERILGRMESDLRTVECDLAEQGGIAALVGPTGVGKTTTVAKIAAKYALKHGCQNVALVSTDNYRIGAQEQLRNFGKILGVPVHTANDKESLRAVLAKLVEKRLVLIDTAGMNQRDIRLAEQLKTIGGDTAIKTYVVLSATTQSATLNDVLEGFGTAGLAGCMFTKVDEAGSLGGVISAAAMHGLPIAYIGSGQRVPEDLHPADPKRLVRVADKLAKRAASEVDKDLLAVTYGARMNSRPIYN